MPPHHLQQIPDVSLIVLIGAAPSFDTLSYTLSLSLSNTHSHSAPPPLIYLFFSFNFTLSLTFSSIIRPLRVKQKNIFTHIYICLISFQLFSITQFKISQLPMNNQKMDKTYVVFLAPFFNTIPILAYTRARTHFQCLIHNVSIHRYTFDLTNVFD